MLLEFVNLCFAVVALGACVGTFMDLDGTLGAYSDGMPHRPSSGNDDLGGRLTEQIAKTIYRFQFGMGKMVWQLFLLFAERLHSARRITCNTLSCVSLMVLSYYRSILIGIYIYE